MKLILNLNNHDYKDFLNSKVEVITIALEGFSCGYLTTYSLDELPSIIKEIHSSKKQVYLAINKICNEVTINKLSAIMKRISNLEIDGFYLSDFGVFQIFIENKLTEKVIFNPVTSITNKYTLSILNSLNIHHACIANELNLKEVLETANYNNGCMEILGHGYYQICNSKRKLLSTFLKKFKVKSDSSYYHIKEENRDYAYPIIEIDDDLLVYIDKQRATLSYLNDFENSNIEYLRIDTIFLNSEEVHLLIDTYHDVINKKSTIEQAMDRIKNTNSNFKCLDNISILKKEKNNE